MGLLTDFSKLFGKKIISYFIWIYVYCFLFSLDSNFFVCSYLKKEFVNVENNILFIFFFFFVYTLYLLFNKLSLNTVNTNNFINIQYILNLFKNQNLIYILNLFFTNFYLNITNILLSNKNNLFISSLIFLFQKLKSLTLVWYPIYKAYSIFGFYKSTRLKFIDLKNENLKRFKY